MNDASPETTGAIDTDTLFAAQFHELKNELGELVMALDETARQHPELAQALEGSRLNTRSIVDRLLQTLTLYKHQAGQLRLNIEAHTPADFLDELVAEARNLAGQRLRIERIDSELPSFWFFDRHLASVALVTALHNALEFAATRIQIGASLEDGFLVFSVHDDSQGYPAHILEEQGELPGKSVRGTGLGLYFAQTIARAHACEKKRGKLQLSNEGGAVFRLCLP